MPEKGILPHEPEKRSNAMEKLRAEDIMIPLESYPHIPHWFTLRQAMVELEKSEIDSKGRRSIPRVLLVFNEKYQLLGIARRRDIMRGLEPKYLLSKSLEYRKKLFDVKIDPNLSEMNYEKLITGIKEQADRPISDVMLPIMATVEYDDHIIKLIYEMVDNNLSLLPVFKEGKIVGVVRSVDIFHEMARLVI
jgi:CBS-domain-containing membrane protein